MNINKILIFFLLLNLSNNAYSKIAKRITSYNKGKGLSIYIGIEFSHHATAKVSQIWTYNPNYDKFDKASNIEFSNESITQIIPTEKSLYLITESNYRESLFRVNEISNDKLINTTELKECSFIKKINTMKSKLTIECENGKDFEFNTDSKFVSPNKISIKYFDEGKYFKKKLKLKIPNRKKEQVIDISKVVP